jgi:hypothetical protein
LDQSAKKGDRTADHHIQLLVKLMNEGVSDPLTRSVPTPCRDEDRCGRWVPARSSPSGFDCQFNAPLPRGSTPISAANRRI